MSAQHSRRRLSKEELALWIEVTKTIVPRAGFKRPLPPDETAQPIVPEAEKKPALSGHEHPKPHKGQYRPAGLPLAPLERRLRQRLSRGQIDIDMKIDLHGMRQDEAHSALRAFLMRAKNNEAKVVLVVTGKGTRGSQADHAFRDERGVLRRTVPQWLAAPELRTVVMGFEEAAPSHGGTGALYVRLRGKRHAGGLIP